MGNVSEDLSADNMKKIGLYLYVYDISFDYDRTDVDDIVNIHKCLMVKNSTK